MAGYPDIQFSFQKRLRGQPSKLLNFQAWYRVFHTFQKDLVLEGMWDRHLIAHYAGDRLRH